MFDDMNSFVVRILVNPFYYLALKLRFANAQSILSKGSSNCLGCILRANPTQNLAQPGVGYFYCSRNHSMDTLHSQL